MNKQEKIEKTRTSNYEILCIMRDHTPEQKNNLVEKIKENSLTKDITTKSEVRNLAYQIEEMKTAEYLLLNLRIERKEVTKVEEVLKNPLVIRYMTINLDSEKRIKVKNAEKLQRNRKFRKPGFKTEKAIQGKFHNEKQSEAK